MGMSVPLVMVSVESRTMARTTPNEGWFCSGTKRATCEPIRVCEEHIEGQAWRAGRQRQMSHRHCWPGCSRA